MTSVTIRVKKYRRTFGGEWELVSVVNRTVEEGDVIELKSELTVVRLGEAKVPLVVEHKFECEVVDRKEFE